MGTILLKCPRWIEDRAALEIEFGIEWTVEADIVTRLAEDDRAWQKFSEFCTRAMILRQRKEKEVESRDGRPETTRRQRRQRR